MTSPANASAPGSSANLGPGFDTLALALEIRCTVTAETSDHWLVEHLGEHRPPNVESDGVLVAARKAIGDDNPLKISVSNDIPLGKGLGSSAAAFVAGTAAALRAVHGDAAPDHVFRIAGELEGHADNVAAAVYGGLVLVPAEGMPMRLPIHPSLRFVIGVPETQLPTTAARTAVPNSFSREILVRSLARVSSLTAGLITADPGLLAAAHGDEIHEGPRTDLSPEVDNLSRVAKSAGALHAARSGAGPAVIAVAGPESVAAIERAFAENGATPLTLSIASTGLV